MTQKDDEFINRFLDKNKEKISGENAELLKQVLVDLIKDQVLEGKDPAELEKELDEDIEIVREDFEDILKQYGLTGKDVKKNALLIARIMKEDFELVHDLDASEAEEHEHHKVSHKFDDNLAAFYRLEEKHRNFIEVLRAMLQKEEQLVSLVPEKEREKYLARFHELHREVLGAPKNNEEWHASEERKELINRYIWPFSHRFLRIKAE